jgi:aryl-alcohol dehydrogenase-like predicted oxidoreductase
LARALKNHRRELSAALRYKFLDHLPDMTGGQAALAFALARPEVATAVFGTTSLAHLDENIAAAQISLPDALLARIGSLPDAAPAVRP